MTNRALARQSGRQFEELATDPTTINKQRAQTLYEEMFVMHSTFIGSCKDDFHVGEMHCDKALLALDIHRHPNDVHLAVRGNFKLMKGCK